ncbi:hypothetical protein ACFLYE_03085 [Chloroflexota bacterium]
MAKQAKLKCLRCGYEYPDPAAESAELQERTCPRCRSNSVRLIQDEKKGAD